MFRGDAHLALDKSYLYSSWCFLVTSSHAYIEKHVEVSILAFWENVQSLRTLSVHVIIGEESIHISCAGRSSVFNIFSVLCSISNNPIS